MNIERVRQIIEAYGGDPSRWPEEERAQAKSILESSPQLNGVLDEARRLDVVLDRLAPVTVPAALRDRIVAGASRASDKAGLTDRFLEWLLHGTRRERILRPVMASLLPLLLGWAVGAFTSFEGSDELLAQNQLANDVAELAFNDTALLESSP